MSTLWGLLALAADAVALAALVTLHVLPTGLSPVADPVSQYGISRYKVGYRVLTLAMAVAGAAVALGLPVALPGAVDGVLVWVWLFAVARAVISWAPMDEPGARPTGRGLAHLGLAMVTFLAAALMGLRLGRVLEHSSTWPSTAGLLRVLGVYVAAAAVATLVAGPLRVLGQSVFGLVERALYAGILLWLAVVGWSVLTT